MKTAALQRNWGAKIVKDLVLFGEKWSFGFVERTQSLSGKVTEFW